MQGFSLESIIPISYQVRRDRLQEERLHLAVPIEAVVMIEEDNEVLLISEEAFVY